MFITNYFLSNLMYFYHDWVIVFYITYPIKRRNPSVIRTVKKIYLIVVVTSQFIEELGYL